MNIFEVFGVFILGSLFNVVIVALGVGLISKQIGAQVKQVVAVGRDAIVKVKGAFVDGE